MTAAAAAAAKSLQSCPTLCDPIDASPPGSSVPGILQARTLEWVVISFCNAWKWKVKVKSFSRSVVSDPQWPYGLQPTRLLCPWDFPGRSTGVGCHCNLTDTWTNLCNWTWEWSSHLWKFAAWRFVYRGLTEYQGPFTQEYDNHLRKSLSSFSSHLHFGFFSTYTEYTVI